MRTPRLQASAYVPRGVAYRMAVPLNAGGRVEHVVLVNAEDLADLRRNWERLHGDAPPALRDAAIADACERTFRAQHPTVDVYRGWECES